MEAIVQIPCRGAIQRGLCQADCCGPIPFPVQEYRRLRHKAYEEPQVEILSENQQYVFPLTNDLKCVFLHRDTLKCQIYSERPDVCRNYGAIEDLPCPCFKMNGALRTRAERRQMRRKIDKAMKEMVERNLKRVGRKI